MANFTWGNSSTLNLAGDPDGTELNRRLRLFWQEHYTANRMTLVLQSKHELNQLEEWAVSIFQGIPSTNSQPACPPNFKDLGFPFDTPRFKRVLKVVPVKDVHQVCSS
jgi:secreted Zn-dependent insulinase-like peptidase